MVENAGYHDGGGQEENRKAEPLITVSKSKKRVFGECIWKIMGSSNKYLLFQWCDAFTVDGPIRKIQFEAVSTSAQQTVVRSWTRKSLFSVW